MNFKSLSNIFLAIALGLVIALTIQTILKWTMPQYFDTSKKTSMPTEIKSGQAFTAPLQQEIMRPIQTTIKFAPYSEAKPTITEIKTSYGSLFFSNILGTLEKFNFKKGFENQERILSPINPLEKIQSNNFAIALDDQTPYVYNLIEKKETNDTIQVIYKAEGQTAIITKQFNINKNLPKIDLSLNITPVKTDAPVQARIFVQAPFIKELDQDHQLMGIMFDDRQRLQKENLSKTESKFWFAPTFFGAEDRFFLNVLIGDKEGFSRRAYFSGLEKKDSNNISYFILESSKIEKPTTWDLSFYCGPKDSKIMSKIDPRLEKTLDYGWLSPLIKGLLYLLDLIYNIVKNYGWAILLLTLLIRLLLIPLTFKGHKAMEKQKEFQRKMQYLEQKYKDDKETLMKERTELTKKYGMSNMMGCLPQLLQLPILFALNRLLSSSIELYQAPFIFWIHDLSAKDPYYVFPILSGLGLLLQVTSDTDAKRSMMTFLMAGLLVVVTANLSAGLTLYLCANTWLSIAQTYAQKKLKL